MMETLIFDCWVLTGRNFNPTIGDISHVINVKDTRDTVTLVSGVENHKFDVLETNGDMSIIADGGGEEEINVNNTV